MKSQVFTSMSVIALATAIILLSISRQTQVEQLDNMATLILNQSKIIKNLVDQDADLIETNNTIFDKIDEDRRESDSKLSFLELKQKDIESAIDKKPSAYTIDLTAKPVDALAPLNYQLLFREGGEVSWVLKSKQPTIE